MRTVAFATPLLIAGLAATPAAATPAMTGKYTISGTEVCQVVTSGSSYINKGKVIQQLGTISLTSTSTGATGTYTQYAIKGSLADQTTPMGAKIQSISVVVTVTGTANPYGLSMKATTGGKTISSTGKIQLDDVVSGVAQRATIVALEKSGDVSTYDCDILMTLVHQ